QAHRSLIWFTVWSSVVHARIMAVPSVPPPHSGQLLGDVPALLLLAIVLGGFLRGVGTRARQPPWPTRGPRAARRRTTGGASRVHLALIRPEGRRVMPKYLIERDSRKRGSSRPSSFGTSRGGRARSSNALGRRSSGCRLVTDDRIYYVYIAPDEELVRSHAQH